MDLKFDNVELEREQLAVRICWYYFKLGMTQQEIASALGIGRVRVNRILGDARKDGMVKITIHSPLAETVALEQELKSRYGLVHAEVIPSRPDLEDMREVIGRNSVPYVSSLLTNDITLGVGWGKTLRAMARSISVGRVVGSSVAALMGSFARRSSINTFEATTTLAMEMEAECYYLAGPVLADSEQSRDMIFAEQVVKEAYAKAMSVDVALQSVGGIKSETLREMLGISEEMFEGVAGKGAIGNLNGYFLDENAEIVDHPFNRRVVAVRPWDLSNVRNRVMISGGATKAPMIKALLDREYIHSLITDESCAKAVLEL